MLSLARLAVDGVISIEWLRSLRGRPKRRNPSFLKGTLLCLIMVQHVDYSAKRLYIPVAFCVVSRTCYLDAMQDLLSLVYREVEADSEW